MLGILQTGCCRVQPAGGHGEKSLPVGEVCLTEAASDPLLFLTQTSAPAPASPAPAPAPQDFFST